MTDFAKVGWVEKPLGEICTLQRGFDLPKRLRKTGKFPLVTSSGPTDTHSEAKVKGPGVATGRSGSIGNVFFVEDDFWPLNTALYVKDFHGNDPRFIYHLLRYVDLGRFASGAGVPTLNRNDVHGERYWIPTDIEEQKRIVAVLDAAFEGLTCARAHAEANLQNARELFETSLSSFIERHKDGWNSTTLGEAYDVRDGTHDSPKYHPTGRALITSKNLGRDGLHFEKVKFISEEDYASICRRSGVDKGDVLFAMIGTIGNPIVVDVDPDFAIKNVALIKMKEGRSGQFLRYMLRSKNLVEKMQAEAKGTTQKFVGLGYLRSFPIMLPEPITELNMVDELDRIEAQCRSAEALYEIKLRDLDDLRQSLLQKAFAGELT